MTTRLFSRYLLAAFIVSCAGWVTDVRAGDQVEVDAKLIWATNHQNPPDKSYKRVDPELSRDLQLAFKWKNYFIINSKAVETPKKKQVVVEMSDKCHIKIKNLGDDMFELWILGKDPNSGEMVPLATGKQKMGVEQKMMLIGVNDNESGWVVKLCRHEK